MIMCKIVTLNLFIRLQYIYAVSKFRVGILPFTTRVSIIKNVIDPKKVKARVFHIHSHNVFICFLFILFFFCCFVVFVTSKKCYECINAYLPNTYKSQNI